MFFDWLIYKNLNPDLEVAGVKTKEQLTNHYIQCGIKEKRKYNIYQIYPDFNYVVYKNNYTDLQSLTKLDLERHWTEFGHKENRTYRKKIVDIKSKPVSNVKQNKNVHRTPITIIIPTIGRLTLLRAITSIKNQSHGNWKCIVIFDGINIPENITSYIGKDTRFKLLKINKVGVSNHAARVRNAGLKLVTNGWVGFLDDDDALSPYYVEHMNDYILKNPNLSCVIFRMMYSDNNVIPRENSVSIYEGNVGISFCYNSELLKKGFFFTPCSCEDYVLVNKIRDYNYKIYMSNLIGYFVRPQVDITKEYVSSLSTKEKELKALMIN
jgi:hypothetical protein